MKPFISIKRNDTMCENIHQKLRAHNDAYLDRGAQRDFTITICDNEQLIAGLAGEIFGQWMLIDYLIVDEHYRKQGHGETLLAEAEALARQKGCQFMALSTFDFQGPHYYPKFGFKEVYVRRHFPKTGSEHFFEKKLL